MGSGVVTIDGSLTVSPSPSNSASDLPSMSDGAPLRLTSTPKQYNVKADGLRSVATANSSTFVTLSGVGTTDTVTQANFVYLRSSSAVRVRMTFANALGGSDIVSTFPLFGTHISEPSLTEYCKLIEVAGVSQMEWFATGMQ